MANYIKGFATNEGEKRYDFDYLGNIPEIFQSMLNISANKGQFFQISSVDQNGKITAVEPVDAPESTEASGIYILGQNETVDDAPQNAILIIDPHGNADEPSGKAEVYVLGEDETIEDVPQDIVLVIDLDAESDEDNDNPGENVDLTGYAKEQWVRDNFQQKGNYLTAVPDGYATEQYVKDRIAEIDNGDIDLSEYAKKTEVPTKPEDIGAQPAGNYALKSEIPNVPVQSVNGKTGAITLNAADVNARPNTWMPTAQDVGALPNTYIPPTQTAEQVGADSKGTAASLVSQHNTADDSHNDIRLELQSINNRLTAFFDSDDQTLDELSEIVAYITNNKTLIDSITTSKVNVADIINNLTTNVNNKPLSAAQGVVLKELIDTLATNLSNYQPKGDYALTSAIPTKVSQLQNDSSFITKNDLISETWTFTLEDGTTVTKKVVIL